jgi:hypothetical protein
MIRILRPSFIEMVRLFTFIGNLHIVDRNGFSGGYLGCDFLPKMLQQFEYKRRKSLSVGSKKPSLTNSLNNGLYEKGKAKLDLENFHKRNSRTKLFIILIEITTRIVPTFGDLF